MSGRRGERLVNVLLAKGFRHIDVTIDDAGRAVRMELSRSGGMLWHFGPGGDEW